MLEPERLIAHHAAARLAWLRAAALRSLGGTIAIAALLIAVAAAALTEGEVLRAGLGGLIAGALALAMTEYAGLAAAGRAEGQAGGPVEAPDAAGLVVHRRAGPRDDLVAAAAGGLADYRAATPLQVAATSAGTFACGGLLPLAAASAFHLGAMPLGIALVALAAVAALAACGAPAGGVRPGAFALRTTTWAAAGFAGAFAAGRIVGTMLV